MHLFSADLQHKVDAILNNDHKDTQPSLRTPPIGTRHCEELEDLRDSGDQYYAECFKNIRKEIAKAIVMPTPEIDEKSINTDI